MAKNVAIKIDVDTKSGVKSIKDVNNELNKTNDAIGDLESKAESLREQLIGVKEGTEEYKKLNDELKQVETNLNKAKKSSIISLKTIASGFRAVGLAIKATGLGILIGLFFALKKVLEESQPVLDFAETSFTTISLVMHRVADALKSVFTEQSKANDGFKATITVVRNVIKLALAPLKIAFLTIKSAVISTQLAWEDSFLGGGDPVEIARLQRELMKVVVEIKQIGEDAIVSGKAIVDNIGQAVDEVVNTVKAGAGALADISISKAIADADEIVQMRKKAQISEAINKGILEDYDRQTEKQRQIRDNENVSINDRILANEKLGVMLKKQEQLMLNNANLVVRSAKLNLEANNNLENQIALINARNEVKAVEATIEGKRSEQIVNSVALGKELNELDQISIDRIAIRNQLQSQFNIDQEKSIINRLKLQRDAIKEEEATELLRLQNVIDNTKEGTLLRVEAEQTYLDAKQDYSNKYIKVIDEINQLEVDKQIKQNELLTQLKNSELDNYIDAVKKSYDAKFELAKGNAELELELEIQLAKDIQQVKDDARKEENLKKQEDIEGIIGDITNAVAIASGVITEILDIASQALDSKREADAEKRNEDAEIESEKLKGQLANREISQTQYDDKMEQLNQVKEQKELVAKKKAFEQDKKIAIAKATMTTAQAVLAGLATVPLLPLGLIMAGVAGGLGGVQLGIIGSQKFKAAKGGIVPGNGDGNIDKIDALLAPGEAVINAKSTRMFPNLLSDINQAGGGISLAPKLPSSSSSNNNDTVFNKNNNQILKAYVVESDISNSQSKISRIERSASFG